MPKKINGAAGQPAAPLNDKALNKLLHLEDQFDGLNEKVLPKLFAAIHNIEVSVKEINSEIKLIRQDTSKLRDIVLEADESLGDLATALEAAGSVGRAVRRSRG